MWRSSLLVNLEDCRIIADKFTIKWTLSQIFFDNILSSPHAPSMFWLKPPPAPPHQILRIPMFATPVGNPAFSTQWFLEVMVSELQKSQYNCEDADLWNCNWKSEKNMLTTHAVVFEGLRMRRTKQLIDECLKTTHLDQNLLKCYLIKLCKSRSF